MMRNLDESLILTATLAVLAAACTSAPPIRHSAAGTGGTGTTAGAAGTTGAAGIPGEAGTTGGGGVTSDAGASGSAGVTGEAGTSGVAGSGTAGTTGAGGATGAAGSGSATDGGAGSTGAAGVAGSADGGAGKNPSCVSNDVAGAINRVKTIYSECDVEGQAIDFDVAADYLAADYNGKVLKPGYDPSMTPVTISTYGTALSGYQVQSCHPYCYKQNLTIGVDFVPGSDAGLRGEIFFDFPAAGMGLPITSAKGRASLGWLYLDGPPLPAGATITAQMELKSTDNGLLVTTDASAKAVMLKKWTEFRYFPIDMAFTAADVAKLTKITTMGFKLTMATAGAAEWHGVIYADHFQVRM